jgi:glycosyltransferase involved in cell wall biosynthesis
VRPSIAILTGNHLCHNPRVLKEATALAEAGFAVEVLGGWFEQTLKARDEALLEHLPFKFTPVIDLTGKDRKTWWKRFKCRLYAKVGQGVFQYGRLESRLQLGYAVSTLGTAARKSAADLFIAHSEAGLTVAEKLLSGRKLVGVDMEDWFSEDLLPEARLKRPLGLLRNLEQRLLRHGVRNSCTSKSMSSALALEYSCEPPTVVYNAFAWEERGKLDRQNKDRRDRRLPSIHWYSQTLGFGRGLEDLIATLPHLRYEAEIHLRGREAAGFEAWLKSQVPEVWRKRICIHGLVSNEELLSRIAEHDIGFAGELKYCRSRDLTVTNKLLHYLLGGLAIVASETSGQREIAKQAPIAVRLYEVGNPRKLAEVLNSLLGNAEGLRAAKAASLTAAERSFSWERVAPIVVRSVEATLKADSNKHVQDGAIPLR